MQRVLAGLFWILLYIAIVLSPLAVMSRQPAPAGRSFLIELSVAIGFVAFMQIGLQFVIVARFRAVTAPYGIDIILQYHRQIAIIAAALVVIHPAVLLLRMPSLLPLLNPFGGTAASRWGVASTLAFALLLLTSLMRKQLGLSYEWWRMLHILFSTGVLGAAVAHIVMAGAYTNSPGKVAFLAAFAVAIAGVLAYLRLGRPCLMLRKPYRVVDVIQERGRSWTVAVEPEGHEGMRFSPGQFVWMTLRSPFSFDEHPFSFSSSAEETRRLEFGIKELGDFTGNIGRVALGTRVYLEGPHGSFSVDRHPAPGYVFIAGGIGITPIYSMIRTLADRQDIRPLLLIYGTRTVDHAPFREQLQELTTRTTLQIVHVVDEPPGEWPGERGPIDEAVLRRVLPKERISREFFICGPDPMMTALEAALLRQGIPSPSIHLERFNLV